MRWKTTTFWDCKGDEFVTLVFRLHWFYRGLKMFRTRKFFVITEIDEQGKNIRSEFKIWDSFQLPYKQWSRSDLACLVDISHKLHKQNQTLLLLMVWHPWILDEDLDAQLCHHWFYMSVKHQVVIIWDKNIQFDCRTYDTDKLMNLYYTIHCDSLFLLTWNINWSMKPCFLNRKTSSTTENAKWCKHICDRCYDKR